MWFVVESVREDEGRSRSKDGDKIGLEYEIVMMGVLCIQVPKGGR